MLTIPGDSPAFLEDIEPFGLAAVAKNPDAGRVELSGVDTYYEQGVQPIAYTAPAPAKSSAGVELAGGAERAITAKPEAYNKTGRRYKPDARHLKREGKIERVSGVTVQGGRQKPSCRPRHCTAAERARRA